MLKGIAGMMGVKISDADIELFESLKTLLALFPKPAIHELSELTNRQIDKNSGAIALCWKPEDYSLSKLENLAMILNDVLPRDCQATELDLTETTGKGKNAKPVVNKYNALIFFAKPEADKP